MITAKTEILTKAGWLPAKDVGDTQDIFDAITGQWVEGYAYDTGSLWYDCMTYTLVPYTGAAEGKSWEFVAPRPLCVPLIGGLDTWDLRVKDTICPNIFDCGYDEVAWVHGFMYRHSILGHSGLDPKKYPLYCHKLTDLKTRGKITTPEPGLPVGKTPVQLGSFIKGYLSADGWYSRLTTIDQDFFQFFVDNHGYAGLVLTGLPKTRRKYIKMDSKTKFFNHYEIQYAKGAEFTGFRVLTVDGPISPCPKLYNVYMPEGHDYVIKGGWTLRGD